MKMGMIDMDKYIPSHLKEELVWAADKQLRVTSTIILKNSYSTKDLKKLMNNGVLTLK